MSFKLFGYGVAATLAVGTLGTGEANAIRICVNPAKATCQATIQAAVTSAAAADIISISRGTYFENVVIPAGKDGLIIRGSSTAILDLGDDGVAAMPNMGVGIMVGSNNVTIQGITIRNGNDVQIQLENLVTGTLIKRIRSVNSNSDFVASDVAGNDNTTILSCDVFAVDGSAASIVGNGLRFASNKVRQASSTAVNVTGNDAIVERNQFVGIENGDAVNVTGNNADVVRNKITGVDSRGVRVLGDDALVQSNRLSATVNGIQVTGQRPVVKSNRLKGTVSGGDSIDVTCNTDCATAMVVGNRTENIGDDTTGFNIFSDAVGMLIDRNQTRDGIDTGFDLNVMTATVIRNRVVRTGGDGEDCFSITGNSNTIDRNTAQSCMGSGFEINGNTNSMTSNRVAKAGEDGIRISAGSLNTTLTRNTVKEAGLVGIRVEDGGTPATGTTLTSNRGSKSRFDLCDEGLTTTQTGNTFASELAVTQDGTDDCPSF